jgi:hypothetical protein
MIEIVSNLELSRESRTKTLLSAYCSVYSQSIKFLIPLQTTNNPTMQAEFSIILHVKPLARVHIMSFTLIVPAASTSHLGPSSQHLRRCVGFWSQLNLSELKTLFTCSTNISSMPVCVYRFKKRCVA